MASTSQDRTRLSGRTSNGFGDTFALVACALKLPYYQWEAGRTDLIVSPALVALFGDEARLWTQQRWLEAIHPDDRQAYRAARISYLKGDAEDAEFRYRARIANGDHRWLREQATLERDAAGRVTRLVGLVSDMTEAEQREAENRALRARFPPRSTMRSRCSS